MFMYIYVYVGVNGYAPVQSTLKNKLNISSLHRVTYFDEYIHMCMQYNKYSYM